LKKNDDVIYQKVENIRRCLRRIKEVTGLQPETLEDINIEDIFVLNLQRAIQSAIDLAIHIIATQNWEMPRTMRESFDVLRKNKVIPPELSEQLKKMVGFRNIAIHDYTIIDKEILKNILQHRLKDLETFYQVVLEKLSD